MTYGYIDDPIAGPDPYEPLKHVEELKAEVARLRGTLSALRGTCKDDLIVTAVTDCARLRGERDHERHEKEAWLRTIQAVDRYLCALIEDDDRLANKRSHVETIAAIVADRDTLRARLAQIQGIAADHADGSPEAHRADQDMARIVDLCIGKEVS